MPQEIETELEIVDRCALVRGMDQPRGQIVVHRPGGKEAVGDGTEGLAQPMAVSEPQAADRHRAGFRLDAFDERLDRAPQRRLDRRARPALALEPLELPIPLPERAPDDLFDFRL